MKTLLVSGLINLETTLRVERFPLEYFPVCYPFFGVHTTVSGVGYNVAKALQGLGDGVRFLSLIGEDSCGEWVRQALARDGLPAQDVLTTLKSTPQSVILYDPSGRRQIHVDLKDIQEKAYPPEHFEQALSGCAWAALCTINFSRPLLAQAQNAAVPIATDVHTICDLYDPYETDFLRAAQVLFMSDEKLPCPPEEWVRRVQNVYGAEIIVVGLGAAGALLAVRSHHFLERLPAVYTRPVVNTIGAGDALFSAFVHFYAQNGDPYAALRKAMLFASWKIGESGAADGFLAEAEINRLFTTDLFHA